MLTVRITPTTKEWGVHRFDPIEVNVYSLHGDDREAADAVVDALVTGQFQVEVLSRHPVVESVMEPKEVKRRRALWLKENS
jgi:hypothetical protein